MWACEIKNISIKDEIKPKQKVKMTVSICKALIMCYTDFEN